MLWQILVASVVLVSASADSVHTLTDANFGSEMAKLEYALVKFYAPWCGHCKSLAPHFIKASDTLAANDPPVSLVDVDCTIHTKVCGEYGVSGYPTLKTFRHGKNMEDYKGGRTEADIVKTMLKSAGPSSIEIDDKSKFDKFVAGKTPGVVGFFDDAKANGVVNYLAVADELRGKVRFAHTYSADVATACGRTGGDIYMYRPPAMKSKFEDQEVAYGQDKYTVGTIRKFVKENTLGLAPVITTESQAELGFPQVVVLYNVDYARDPKGTQYWRNRVMKVATNFIGDKSKVKFGVAQSDDWGELMNAIGKTFEKLPIVVGFDDKDTKFVMEADFTSDGKALHSFVDDFNAGRLEAYIKSEAIPHVQGDERVLVAKNFKDEITGEADALIEFYAPWCGHCKSLAPKWGELATEHGRDKNIVIAKMDATANDVPSGFEVKGFPTIFWLPAGGQPVKYEGAREVADFNKYIKQHRTKPFEDKYGKADEISIDGHEEL